MVMRFYSWKEEKHLPAFPFALKQALVFELECVFALGCINRGPMGGHAFLFLEGRKASAPISPRSKTGSSFCSRVRFGLTYNRFIFHFIICKIISVFSYFLY